MRNIAQSPTRPARKTLLHYWPFIRKWNRNALCMKIVLSRRPISVAKVRAMRNLKWSKPSVHYLLMPSTQVFPLRLLLMKKRISPRSPSALPTYMILATLRTCWILKTQESVTSLFLSISPMLMPVNVQLVLGLSR